VAGHWELPETCLPVDKWVERLKNELTPGLGVNGIRVGRIFLSNLGVEVANLVIDMDPLAEEGDAIERAQMAVGFVALTSELDV